MESQEQANDKLIDLLEGQINELVLMSKIELGDDVIQEIKRLKEIINTKTTIKSLEEEAEQFAKTRNELDPIYANGLYYGFIECGKSEWLKNHIENLPIHILDGVENIKVFIQNGVIIVEKNNQSEKMSKEIITIKMFHAEVMQENGLSIEDLPKDIQSKIKGFNLINKKFVKDNSDEKMRSMLQIQTIRIAFEIQNWLEDNEIEKKDIDIEDEYEFDDEINSRTIDISDLAGVYNLGDMPNIIQRIKDRIEKVKNGERLFISTMEMSHHLRNCLILQFETLTELSNVTKKQVSTMQGMGVKVLAELEKVMEQHGIQFKPLY
jgi:hypothetical protein